MKGLNLKDWEVRGLLDGWITMLCRVVKPQPEISHELPVWRFTNFRTGKVISAPFGAPGTELFGREAWTLDVAERPPVDQDGNPTCEEVVIYRATDSDPDCYKGKWNSAQSMPKEYSRLRLKTKSVVCKMVQDVTEEEVIALGFKAHPAEFNIGVLPTEVFKFKGQFTQDHGPGAWASNPWVFLGVVETKKDNPDEKA